ncbi:UDP-2,3-diacylglucosamine diphosphatase LpxI [Candidatus Pelagibacter sp.]|nr:UDP-2,3-diacylglucosamine diphosphatase LpxI [Candidatus Pelagibacter sp.]
MIGLFFGDTDLPKQILRKIKKNKIKYFIIDLSKDKSFKKDPHSQSISIGQFGKIFEIFKINKCNKVLFAGRVKKPRFSSLKMDLKGLFYLPRIIKAAKLGDAAILKSIINILNKEKIKVVSSIAYNPELTLSRGTYTKVKPNKEDIIFIRKGIKSLDKLSPHNHIQGLVINENNVILKETSKGTKKMLQSINIKKKSKNILIKFPKKKQDLRLDLPTIGLDTLKDCKKAGIKGIVLKSKKNIFMDKNKSINFANKNKIFIKVL